MTTLTQRIQYLAESETLAMSRKSRELKALGHDVINLSLGEPDFNTPDYIKEAAKEAIDKNFTFYPPVAGYEDLRKAICLKLKRDNNLDYECNQIVVSTGAKQSIANVVLSLVNPGDEVLVPAPYWVSYKEIIKVAEGKAVFIPATIENDFKVTPQQLEAAITPKTRLLIYSSPCNPTGSVYSRDELKGIAEVIVKYPNITIIADEIYEHINFIGKHESICQFDFIKDRVVLVNGVSKGFAMTGWRIGFIAAPVDIAKACDKLQGQFTSGASSIAQRAALKAFATAPDDTPDMKIMLKAFRERRDLMLKLLAEIPGMKLNHPDGAFYIFPDISCYFGKSDGKTNVANANDLCLYLLNKVYVALVPGDAFGDPRCIRFSYATGIDKLTEAVRRIKQALEELR
ncbi:MAG: pyridoxal phosphate-dependent aminotransferase [Alphaproteobacteria bacterium]|nr:pyridoxal phosphate-dependent aminotransferase [Alphaproteobacteria bacterium]